MAVIEVKCRYCGQEPVVKHGRAQKGWVYLAIVLDLFSRRVIGWCLAGHVRETLVASALQMAFIRRKPTGTLMQHSDWGCQYMNQAYQARLAQSGIIFNLSSG